MGTCEHPRASVWRPCLPCWCRAGPAMPQPRRGVGLHGRERRPAGAHKRRDNRPPAGTRTIQDGVTRPIPCQVGDTVEVVDSDPDLGGAGRRSPGLWKSTRSAVRVQRVGRALSRTDDQRPCHQSAGSILRWSGRSHFTFWRNHGIGPIKPTRSAITTAGRSGSSLSSTRPRILSAGNDFVAARRS